MVSHLVTSATNQDSLGDYHLYEHNSECKHVSQQASPHRFTILESVLKITIAAPSFQDISDINEIEIALYRVKLYSSATNLDNNSISNSTLPEHTPFKYVYKKN
ncbi:hypothetical protein FRX31_004893 [Thalictrum thalictroides]|uniref:Uncharacterized protein n=1 Tax=Thalictrum thalictroides TaxID=46969 RepID=A0A7J6X807_THATH|nr:hypothetical protein FRX31_004893 [Thalictrum thalictroides]